MWFRQLSIFAIPKDAPIDINALLEAMKPKKFQPAGGLDWFSEGWIPPAKHLDLPIFTARNTHIMSLRREDKVLPPSVVADFVDQKIAEIEEEEMRKPGRKERLTIKEQITDDLLPKAFTRRSLTSGFIHQESNLIFVGSASPAKSEGFISKLREALPPFPAALPRSNLAPHSLMTDWLAAGSGPEGFELDQFCELKEPGSDGGTIKCARLDVSADEIRQLIASGRQVAQLGLIWREKIRFILTDALTLKKIQYLDVLEEEAAQGADDAAALFEATFTLASAELVELVHELLGHLGGLSNHTEPATVTAATPAPGDSAATQEGDKDSPWDK